MLVRFYINKDRLIGTPNCVKILGGADVLKEYVPKILLEN